MLYNEDETGIRRPIEESRFEQTAEEIARMFGGGMFHRPIDKVLTGFWCDRGIIDRDELVLFEVDIPDTLEARRQIEDYARNTLMKRFEQKAIYLRLVGPIETILVIDETIT